MDNPPPFSFLIRTALARFIAGFCFFSHVESDLGTRFESFPFFGRFAELHLRLAIDLVIDPFRQDHIFPT